MAKVKKAQREAATTFDEPELARRLNVSPKSIYRRRRKREIPFYRFGNLIRYDDTLYARILEIIQRDVAA